jgi:hypothetical protein
LATKLLFDARDQILELLQAADVGGDGDHLGAGLGEAALRRRQLGAAAAADR